MHEAHEARKGRIEAESLEQKSQNQHNTELDFMAEAHTAQLEAQMATHAGQIRLQGSAHAEECQMLKEASTQAQIKAMVCLLRMVEAATGDCLRLLVWGWRLEAIRELAHRNSTSHVEGLGRAEPSPLKVTAAAKERCGELQHQIGQLMREAMHADEQRGILIDEEVVALEHQLEEERTALKVAAQLAAAHTAPVEAAEATSIVQGQVDSLEGRDHHELVKIARTALQAVPVMLCS